MSSAQNIVKSRETDVRMRENVDSDSNEDECAYVADRQKRKSWRVQSHAAGYRRNHSHHSVSRDAPCPGYERSRYDVECRETTRRKKKSRSQTHHCPSCYCDAPEPPPSTKPPQARCRNGPCATENLEASLKWCENLLANDPSLLQSLDAGPNSPRSYARYAPRRSVLPDSSASCRATRGQNAEQSRRLSDMMKDMVNRGLVNEETDIRGAYAHLPPVKSILKKDSKRQEQHKKDPEQSMTGRNERDYNSGEEWERLVKEQEELENDREELKKLNHEVHVYEKWKENGKRANQSNPAEDGAFLEKRKSADRLEAHDEPPKAKTSGPAVSKLPVRRSGPKKTPNSISQGRAEKTDEQAKNQDSPKVEENTTYRCVPSVCRCGSCENEESEDLTSFSKSNREAEQKESRNPRYRSACQEPLTIQEPDYKTIEEETNDERLEDRRNDDDDSFERNMYAGGDLDLHASKSYILDLIDRALSREFGTFPGEKKGDAIKETSARRNGQLEGVRAFQGDYCLPRQYASQQDYVKGMKSLRWEYLNHIQEDLKTLSEIERFLDGCGSPRRSATNLTSDERAKERPKQQQSQQERQTATNL